MMGYARDMMVIVLLFSMLASSMMLLNGTGPETAVSAESSRGLGDTLIVENGTTTIDKTSPQEQTRWEKIVFGNNGSLVIRGALVITKELICQENYGNTSLILENDDNLLGRLTIQEGKMDVTADMISMKGAILTVSNSGETLGPGEDGHNSIVKLISRRNNLIVNNTKITIEGQNGVLAGTNQDGGNGGSAKLTMMASGNNFVSITGSTIEVNGGEGGGAFSPSYYAGEGGEVVVEIVGKEIILSHTSILGTAGDAGSAGSSTGYRDGGNCQFRIRSLNGNMNIFSTSLEAVSGLASSGKTEVFSSIDMKALAGSIIWDKDKPEALKRESISKLIGGAVQMEARDGSTLYQVDVGDNPPYGLSGTSVEIFWWARIVVNDNTGSPMSQVAIRYFIPPDTQTLYPTTGPIYTDVDGEAWLEMAAYRNDQFIWYTFTAEDEGGADGSSDRVRFNSNMNLDIQIVITTIIIDELSADTIGGDHRFYGVAESGAVGKNIVNRVVIYLGDEVLGEAVDTSPSGSTPFLTWEYIWDTTQVEDGIYTFSFIAFDNSYQAVLEKVKEINQESVPHPGLLDEVIVTDPERTMRVPAGEITDVHVNQNEKLVDFDVRIFDIDYRSGLLIYGKELVSAEVRLVYEPTEETLKTWVTNEFRKVNESGGFSFEVQLDTSKKPGTSEAFDNGLYRLEFDVLDDADKMIKGQFIEFNLFFDYIPNAYAFIDMIDGKRLGSDMVPRTDQYVDYEAFFFSTSKSDTVEVRFNLTRCTDQDSPRFGSGLSYQDLNITLSYRRIGIAGGSEIFALNDQKGPASVEVEFDVEDVGEEATGDFDIWIEVKDQDGLIDSVRYIARVGHEPPLVENSILTDVTGSDTFNIIPAQVMTIVYIIVFVIAIGTYLGILIFIAGKFNSDKKKKMDLLEKKREQDKEEKKDTSIEDEMAGTYDSKKYLKDTGSDKGREEFLKDLGPVVQKPAIPAKPQERAVPPAQIGAQKPTPQPPAATQAKPPAPTPLQAPAQAPMPQVTQQQSAAPPMRPPVPAQPPRLQASPQPAPPMRPPPPSAPPAPAQQISRPPMPVQPLQPKAPGMSPPPPPVPQAPPRPPVPKPPEK